MSGAANAEYTQTCKLRYEKQFGTSEWYEVDMHFSTGFELNKATKSYNYDAYKKYAVVFWGENQATVIEISTASLCGQTFTRSCLAAFGNMKGLDQQGRSWEICAGSNCY